MVIIRCILQCTLYSVQCTYNSHWVTHYYGGLCKYKQCTKQLPIWRSDTASYLTAFQRECEMKPLFFLCLGIFTFGRKKVPIMYFSCTAQLALYYEFNAAIYMISSSNSLKHLTQCHMISTYLTVYCKLLTE
jgi:hypothetical protein